jgi:hypothetical protein
MFWRIFFMLERIIAGIVIGFVAGFVLARKFEEGSSTRSVMLGFIALAAISFVSASFMFGAIYGAMGVGEIAIGYWLSKSLIGENR